MIKNREENNKIRKTYESNLRKLRKSYGFTLNEVSIKTGIGKQTLHSWENGSIKNIGSRYDEEANTLAKLYKISRRQLNTLVNDAWLEFNKQTSKYQKNIENKTYLYELRIQNCKTLRETSEYAGITISKLFKFENGTDIPNSKTMSKLARYFSTDLNTLSTRLAEKSKT